MTLKVARDSNVRFFLVVSFFVCLFLNDNVKTHPSSDDLANLVSKLSPSVVNVFTIQNQKAGKFKPTSI